MIKRITKIITVLVVGVFLIPVISFAQSADQEVPPRYTSSSSGWLRSFIENGEVKNLLSINQGYDNNVYLNSAREADPFTQVMFKTTFVSPLTDMVDAVLGYEFMSLTYPQESDVDMFKNGIRIGTDTKITDDIKLSSSYYLDYVDYPNTGDDDFLSHKAEFVIRQDLPYKMYHSFGYEFMFKDYNQRQTRVQGVSNILGFPVPLGILNTGKTRDDLRQTVQYEIGKYFPKDLLKLGFEYYYNDSSERYLNYYDYDSYKVSASLTHVFNDKIFGYASFSSQFRDFRSRVLSTNIGSLEQDTTYIMTSALFYNLNKSLTLGVNYTYRENDSNEPIENYSGSLISLGAYYKF